MSPNRSLSCLVAFLFGATAPLLAAGADSPSKSAAPARAASRTVEAPIAAVSNGLTAEQIVEANVKARGGLAAWRAVSSIRFSGSLDAGGRKHVQLPVVLTMKRPRMSRVELTYQGRTSIQVYDGTNGWKFRPYARNAVESFNSHELSKSWQEFELDGPLIDHEKKAIQVAFEGREQVGDHDTYRLKLTAKDRKARRVWVDAKTFLEVKMDGVDRVMDGHPMPVEITFSDYRTVNGLMIPFVNETRVVGWEQGERIESHKLTIDQVTVNPPLDAGLFAKPQMLAAAPAAPRPGAVSVH
jgi:outer membrane lipoprotein-sorting protein